MKGFDKDSLMLFLLSNYQKNVEQYKVSFKEIKFIQIKIITIN